MKVDVLSHVRASLLNILTRSDRLSWRPGLQMTASINRLAEKRRIRRGKLGRRNTYRGLTYQGRMVAFYYTPS